MSSDLTMRVRRLEETSHLQEMTPEGANFLAWNTAPFEQLKHDAELPIIPDGDLHRVVRRIVTGVNSFAVAGNPVHTNFNVWLLPRSNSDSPCFISGANGAGTAMASRVYLPCARWTAVRDELIAVNKCRVVAAGLRCWTSSVDNTATGSILPGRTNEGDFDSSAYLTQNQVLASCDWTSATPFDVQKGAMVRYQFFEDYEGLDPIPTTAGPGETGFPGLVLMLSGLSNNEVFHVGFVMCFEFQVPSDSAEVPVAHPYDFHYPFLKALAGPLSPYDHTAHSLEALWSRLKAYGEAMVDGGVDGALATGTLEGAAAAAVLSGSKLLLDDVWRLMPATVRAGLSGAVGDVSGIIRGVMAPRAPRERTRMRKLRLNTKKKKKKR